ncbi:MAG TPA: methyltransferase domain-containing protein, partial [Acidimicrobiales bacterium]|nr:methyltransferase domain-containing protein [Acidimicrobiales bacterium]
MGVYDPEQLAVVPAGALRLSRGCGNPTRLGMIGPGDTVIDLGCGGGIDVILAAHQVGPSGTVIGVDFAPEMLQHATCNIAEAGLAERDIRLHLADLADTGLPDGCADVIISNCVINVCPDKDAVYREAYRLLRPGGRLAISDVMLTEALPANLDTAFQETWAGCLGGAVPEQRYFDMVRAAGFHAVTVAGDKPLSAEVLDHMSVCPGPQFTPKPARADLAAVQGKVTSIKFTALKLGIAKAARHRMTDERMLVGRCVGKVAARGDYFFVAFFDRSGADPVELR